MHYVDDYADAVAALESDLDRVTRDALESGMQPRDIAYELRNYAEIVEQGT